MGCSCRDRTLIVASADEPPSMESTESGCHPAGRLLTTCASKWRALSPRSFPTELSMTNVKPFSCSSVRPMLSPTLKWDVSCGLTSSRVAKAEMVAISRLCTSRLSRPRMSPNRCAFRKASMAGQNATYRPVAGPPTSRVWISVPSSMLLLWAGKGLGSRPTSSEMPLRCRSSRTSVNVLSPFKLRGNPA